GAFGISRIADKPNLLTRSNARAVLDGVCSPLDALSAVVVAHRQVVVQMDVLVHRAALPVQVEHAAGAGRGRPVLQPPGLGGNRRRLLRGQDVIALMRTTGTR